MEQVLLVDGLTIGSPILSGGFHVEARIGDSVVIMATMDPPHPAATKASTYVYVDDVDAVYARAIAAGGRRGCRTDGPTLPRAQRDGLLETFGNISTYKGRNSN